MVDLITIFSNLDLNEIGTKVVTNFTVRVLSKPGQSAKQVKEFLEQNIRGYDSQKTGKALERAYKETEQKNIEPKPISTKNLYPLLENISWVEDDYLQEKWANLLASEVKTGGVNPSYINILNNLSSLDAKVLDLIYKDSEDCQKRTPVTNIRDVKQLESNVYEEVAKKFGEKVEIEETLENLERMQLIKRTFEELGATSSWVSEQNPLNEDFAKLQMIRWTKLGDNFLQAVGNLEE